ncbi:MAG: dihydropyrimidinase [Firmicutes bacterium]|nr:dihydropyrimidinase [Bacillota bacterium]
MLHIKNGVLVSGSATQKADLWIEGGKIVETPADASGAELIDAAGCLVFPGFIDAHTHMQMDAGATWTADDFASGTAAALAGGTTVILDFATQARGRSLNEALDLWHSRADGHCSCGYGFHMAVTDWNGRTRLELRDMANRGVTSFKAYMAYDNLRISDDALRELLREAAALGGLVGAHCELGDTVNKNRAELVAAGKTAPKYHALSRPDKVEADAVARFLELAGEADAPAWVVHLSTREGLHNIETARARGQRVLTETCPQYLTLTDKVYGADGFEGAKYVCSPPIRNAHDRLALLDATRKGKVDIISTDHCSFNYKGQKEMGLGDFTKIPNGLPGVEHRPALIWTYATQSPERFCALLSENPAKAFGMYPRKGTLSSGADADVVIWDGGETWTIRAAEQVQNVDYSPWEGFQVRGRAKVVLLGGELCAAEGNVLKAGQGKYVARERAWANL